MLNASTIEQLRAMKFSAMAAAFEQQLKEPKSYSQLGFEERFGLMVDAEWNRRQDNKLHRRVRDARLDIPSASMEGIEYIPDRGLDKQQLLRLATCAYIEEGHHVILKGASGSGKTYIACALGYAACTRFKKVRCAHAGAAGRACGCPRGQPAQEGVQGLCPGGFVDPGRMVIAHSHGSTGL